jgi:hypothetical protein
MNNEKNPNPNNDNHWTTHRESQKRPHPSSPLWNDWAAKNPTGAALGLAKVDVKGDLTKLMTAISRGARPVEL